VRPLYMGIVYIAQGLCGRLPGMSKTLHSMNDSTYFCWFGFACAGFGNLLEFICLALKVWFKAVSNSTI
jgi:hypothetical protein